MKILVKQACQKTYNPDKIWNLTSQAKKIWKNQELKKLKKKLKILNKKDKKPNKS